MHGLVRLENITKDYDHIRALDDVSLVIGEGVTGLLGPNGAGKTTLIKVILGLVKLRQGSGEVLGHKLGSQARAIRSRIGYMPEDDCYLPGLSGVEMLQLAARLSGIPDTEALRRSHEILDFCGVEQERYRAVETYSTGMRQKLKFAQAIVHDPPFLILDEPTAGLDPEERETMLSRIQSLAGRAGKAILLSTHILPDVQMTCDSVIILARGRVRICDRLEELNRPRSPMFQVSVLGDAESLADRMRREGFDVESGDEGELTITCHDANLAQSVWTWADELGVGIREFVATMNSLEHIFLEAVGEQRRADP